MGLVEWPVRLSRKLFSASLTPVCIETRDFILPIEEIKITYKKRTN